MELAEKKHRLRLLGNRIDNEVAAGFLDMQKIIELQREYNNLSMQIEAEEFRNNKKPTAQWQKEAINELWQMPSM
jgi:hypothetical protein